MVNDIQADIKLLQAARLESWQPVESIPKDGSVFDLQYAGKRAQKERGFNFTIKNVFWWDGIQHKTAWSGPKTVSSHQPMTLDGAIAWRPHTNEAFSG